MVMLLGEGTDVGARKTPELSIDPLATPPKTTHWQFVTGWPILVALNDTLWLTAMLGLLDVMTIGEPEEAGLSMVKLMVIVWALKVAAAAWVARSTTMPGPKRVTIFPVSVAGPETSANEIAPEDGENAEIANGASPT